MMTKNAEGLSAVSARASRTLRKLASQTEELARENAELREKNASYERVERARVLAREMDEKGLSPELSFDEKVASIVQYPDLEKLGEVIKIAGSGRLDIGSVSDVPGPGSRDNGARSFELFCITGNSE